MGLGAERDREVAGGGDRCPCPAGHVGSGRAACVCNRRGRQTSQLSPTICSLSPPSTHTLSSLCPVPSRFPPQGLNLFLQVPLHQDLPLLFHQQLHQPSLLAPSFDLPPSVSRSPFLSRLLHPDRRPAGRFISDLEALSSQGGRRRRLPSPLPPTPAFLRPSCADQPPSLFHLPLSTAGHRHVTQVKTQDTDTSDVPHVKCRRYQLHTRSRGPKGQKQSLLF